MPDAFKASLALAFFVGRQNGYGEITHHLSAYLPSLDRPTAVIKYKLCAILFGCALFAPLQANDILPIPGPVRDGDKLLLKCGRTYVGELQLSGRRDVTVRTVGDCGKASLTPALPIGGWQRDEHQPNVWFAEPGFQPAQIELDRRFLPQAHHPNAPKTWLRGKSRFRGELLAPLPHPDVAGATLVWRAADWLIQSRTIARYDGRVLTLAPGDDEGFGLLPETEFYVEGKRWMIDSPGEWAYENGRLFVWPTDGQSPEGRIWVAPRSRAIDASGSSGVKIEGIRIFGATLGIDGTDSRGLQIRDSEIDNSGEEAVLAGSGSQIERLHVRGSVQNGIRANDNVRDVRIVDSRFDNIGMLGTPRRSKGAIVFEQARSVQVQRNRITDASYIGIRVFRDAVVTDNVIERACLRLADCGGIYTFARDRQPLNVAIERNHVSGLQGRSSYAIYLDDFANGVSVLANQLVDNPGGLQLHNGFDNEIAGNAFVNSRHEHILFNETAKFATVANNHVRENRFVSAGDVPVYRLWSHHGSAYVARFALFSDNEYKARPKQFAEVEGFGMLNYQDWRDQIGAEMPLRSRKPTSAGGPAPQLTRQRQKE